MSCLPVLAASLVMIASLSPSLTLGQNSAKKETPSPSIPMPQDRAADSYDLYSRLMPVGELGNQGWPHDLYLMADTTTSPVSDGEPCFVNVDPEKKLPGEANWLNPHIAIRAPKEREHDFTEVLEDFDKHCHERLKLTPELMKTKAPLRMLTASEAAEFYASRSDPKAPDSLTEKSKGAPGLSSFSQVFFNTNRTLAMVYADGWCGGRCGHRFWRVFERTTDGGWKVQPWVVVKSLS